MGKGDIKTKKGKIANGSYGARRPHKTHSETIKNEEPKQTKSKAAKK